MQYWKAHYKDALHDADIRIFLSLWTSFAMKAAEKACISKMPFVISARR